MSLNQSEMGDISFVFNDLNGEDWRAHEWATACPASRLASQHIPERRIPLSFGDIGAASPALGITMACRWLARESTGEHNLLVASSTRSGKKSAIIITGIQNHEQ
jgi:hypothetical protein